MFGPRILVSRLATVFRGLCVPDSWKEIGLVDVIVVCHDNDRALEQDGRAYSQLLDPVNQDLTSKGYRVAVVAYPWSVLTGQKAFGSPHSCNRALLIGWMIDLVYKLGFLPKRRKGKGRGTMRFWLKLLENSRARAVLVIGAPTSLCLAARELGVPLIELLHGYRFNSVPWGYLERNERELPTHILTLDDLSSETFSGLKSKKVSIERVVRPIPVSLAIGQQNTSQNKDLKSIIDFEGTTVLVALQWGYGSDEMFGGQFGNGLFPGDLYDVMDSLGHDVLWVFRLHPVQLRSPYYSSQVSLVKELQTRPNVANFDFSQQSLHLLLPQVDLVLTPSSGIAAEALDLGIPVVFMDNGSEKESLMISYSKDIEAEHVAFWNFDPSALAYRIRNLPLVTFTCNKKSARSCTDVLTELIG